MKSTVQISEQEFNVLKENIKNKTDNALSTKFKFDVHDEDTKQAVYINMVEQVISRDYITNKLKFFYYPLLYSYIYNSILFSFYY